MSFSEIAACISLVVGAIMLFFVAIILALAPYVIIGWLIMWVIHNA